MSIEAPERLRIIAFQEDGGWVAQCLEHDISAQGTDFDTAIARLVTTVNVEAQFTTREHGQAFAGIDPAPQFFADMYESVGAQLSLKCESGHDADLRIAA